MNLVINGLLINYQIAGKNKKAILCLHGWADSGQTFESLVKQLAPEYQVISLDLPGFGGSEMPAKAWELDDFVVFISSFLKKLDIVPYALVGHSNGGAIAIRGLATRQLEAEKLVLLASAGIRRPNSARNKSLAILAKPAKLALKAAPKSTQKRIKQKFYKSIGSDYMIAEHMQTTFQNIVATDVLGDAEKLRLPTLLIYGEDDTSAPLQFGKAFAGAIPGSKLQVIENTGHFVHREQVYKVADLIKEFIK